MKDLLIGSIFLSFISFSCASLFINSKNYNDIIPPENERLVGFIDLLNESDIELRKYAIKYGEKRKVVNENDLLIILFIGTGRTILPRSRRPPCIPDLNFYLDTQFFHPYNSEGVLFNNQFEPIFVVHSKGFYPYEFSPPIQKSMIDKMNINGYYFYIRSDICWPDLLGVGINHIDHFSIDSTGLVFKGSFEY